MVTTRIFFKSWDEERDGVSGIHCFSFPIDMSLTLAPMTFLCHQQGQEATHPLGHSTP